MIPRGMPVPLWIALMLLRRFVFAAMGRLRRPAIADPAPLVARIRGQQRPIRIGFVGVGQIAKAHLKRYADIPGAQIVAAADLNSEELARVAQLHSIPDTYATVWISPTEVQMRYWPGPLCQITDSNDVSLTRS